MTLTLFDVSRAGLSCDHAVLFITLYRFYRKAWQLFVIPKAVHNNVMCLTRYIIYIVMTIGLFIKKWLWKNFPKNYVKSFGNFGKGWYNIGMKMRADCNGSQSQHAPG